MIEKKSVLTILILTVFFLFWNCSSPKENKTIKESDISPGTARIEGTVSEIEPVSNSELNGPCSKVSCIALVKVTSAKYGAAFPQLAIGKEIRIKFMFTLEKTTKDLFPEMEEEYPGLKVGDDFTAIVSTIKSGDKDAPHFRIFGYQKD